MSRESARISAFVNPTSWSGLTMPSSWIARRPGLTQFLGIDEGDAPIEPHIVSFELAAGDRILLASDGLTDMVDEAVIAHAMQSAASVEALACTLRDQALANGGEDNVTIIACEVPA